MGFQRLPFGRWGRHLRRGGSALGLTLAVLMASAQAEDLTLPAAASIVGGAPFFSDVRAFNTSYTDALEVTARYRCFISCTAVGTPEVPFVLEPRESRAFDDIVQNTFQAPNTAGGVEFEHSGSGEQLVVTSRLYSTAPQPTVGMFIPGLRNAEAHATTVLTSIRNGGPNAGLPYQRRHLQPGRHGRRRDLPDHRRGRAGRQLRDAQRARRTRGPQVNGIFTAAGQGGPRHGERRHRGLGLARSLFLRRGPRQPHAGSDLRRRRGRTGPSTPSRRSRPSHRARPPRRRPEPGPRPGRGPGRRRRRPRPPGPCGSSTFVSD